MRVRWWQSIRWRMAIGSILISLVATTLLAITVIVAIGYYYGDDLRQRLTAVATDTSERLGVSYALNGSLLGAVNNVLPNTPQQNSQNQDVLLIVFNVGRPIELLYPRLKSGQIPKGQTGTRLATLLIAAIDPSLRASDYTKLFQAVVKARRGETTVDTLDKTGPGSSPRLYVVQPIFENGDSHARVVGVLLVLPRYTAQDTTPAFIATVTWFIVIAAVIIAVIATLAALLFSRTITRPLALLTGTARVLASGDYSARVQTKARDELGELASTINEMANRLEQDVEELRRQENLRRELIMKITHDLATPLTAIAGLGESLVDGVYQSHEDFEKTGRVIMRETLRLRRLVKDLHVMAKVEAGAMHPQFKPVRLAALVDETLAVLAPEFERANVEPRNEIAFNLPVLLADPDMLQRVFSNLCDNALRHTPSGGSVIIDAHQQGQFVEVSVTDTGSGIPTGALPRVFDRFYRADNSRQEKTGGSGLGLAIVRAIIEAHGGAVWAENAPEGGARILFTLPVPNLQRDQLASMNTMPIPYSHPE